MGLQYGPRGRWGGIWGAALRLSHGCRPSSFRHGLWHQTKRPLAFPRALFRRRHLRRACARCLPFAACLRPNPQGSSGHDRRCPSQAMRRRQSRCIQHRSHTLQKRAQRRHRREKHIASRAQLLRTPDHRTPLPLPALSIPHHRPIQGQHSRPRAEWGTRPLRR